MKCRMSWLAVLAGIVLAVPFVSAEDGKKESSDSEVKAQPSESKPKTDKKVEAAFKATCPVSGSSAKKENASKYREGEAYFCCEKCKAAFDAEPAKYATNANMQLVQTKQFRQTKCPVSGGKVNKEQKLDVKDVKVTFCCEKCKGSLESATEEERITKVFGDAIFTKSFAMKKADDIKKPKQDEKVESIK